MRFPLLFVLFLALLFPELSAQKRVFLREKGKKVKYSALEKDDRFVTLPSGYTKKWREFRGLWVVTAWNLDFPQVSTPYTFMQNFSRLVASAKKKGINTILFQVRPSCDAFYPSKYNPWSQYLTGKIHGGFRSFDPLSYMVKETHRQGLSFHAWLNPYRLKGASPLSKWQILAQLPKWHFARKYPECVLQIPTKKGNLFMLDPGNPKVMEHLINTVREIVRNYKIDGLCIDDYFYPYEGIQNQDSESFRKWNPWKHSLFKWRVSNINMMVRNLSGIVRGGKNHKGERMQFGVSPFGIWMNQKNHKAGSLTKGHESLAGHYADTRFWVKKRYVDYIAPQLYWSFTHKYAPFACLADWWAETVKGTGVKLYIGLTLQSFEQKNPLWNDPGIFANQLLYLSAIPEVKGLSLFSAKGLLYPGNRTAKTNILKGLNYW